MKKIIALILAISCMLSCLAVLSSCQFITGDNNGANENPSGNVGNKGEDYVPDCEKGDHLDNNNDELCDLCKKNVIVIVDFYSVNDLHGKFCDTSGQPGVDELATYFKNKEKTDDHVVLLSSGDIWQGTAESNLTGGMVLTDWMNELDFVSMTLGNHEFDWGEDAIRNNLSGAEFPFLAINVYDNNTNKLADYCTPSIMIERGDLKIGIIGAIGDCYSSISSDMVQNVNFKVGAQLTGLVMAESDRLRKEGADLIVYALHDGYGNSNSGTQSVGDHAISSYYDIDLSDGYVDLVFEAHTHQSYVLKDTEGVYHLQGGGENSGISHVEIKVNSGNGLNSVSTAEIVKNGTYSGLEDDPATEAIEDKYSDIIDFAYSPLGVVSRKYNDSELEDIVAGLYLERGLERWGEDYNIVLGGGFLKTRSPYSLSAGSVTYANILSLLPFDNRLVLCSIKGQDLLDRFINTDNTDYHNAYSEYGMSIIDNISSYETYYVVVDTYTAYYRYNRLTVVDFYDEKVYARDLFADAVKEGRYEIKSDNYTLTSIKDALAIGDALSPGEATVEFYYIKGTVTSVENTTYGNLYITDENGDRIYVYGVYDLNGKRYDGMQNPPVQGDTVVVCSTILKYSGYEIIIELKNATLVEIIK